MTLDISSDMLAPRKSCHKKSMIPQSRKHFKSFLGDIDEMKRTKTGKLSL